jgi:hypothetical protein
MLTNDPPPIAEANDGGIRVELAERRRSVAQAGSLLYRGWAIREGCESSKALDWMDALPTASRRYGRLAICATPAAPAGSFVAQAGSLPCRGLVIREPRESGETLDWMDALPTASRRYGRLAICAKGGTPTGG